MGMKVFEAKIAHDRFMPRISSNLNLLILIEITQQKSANLSS